MEFISLIFARWASLRLSYAALLRIRIKSSRFELRPARVKNYDVTPGSAFGGPLKASDTCKIPGLICGRVDETSASAATAAISITIISGIDHIAI